MKKNNPNLTAEQKLVLFEEETEAPGSSTLNNEKREGSFHKPSKNMQAQNHNRKEYTIIQ